jgi:hypothetical protein
MIDEICKLLDEATSKMKKAIQMAESKQLDQIQKDQIFMSLDSNGVTLQGLHKKAKEMADPSLVADWDDYQFTEDEVDF